MDPRTEPGGLAAAEEFYDMLAPEYDAMTGFAGRLAAAEAVLRPLVERYGVRRALDAGAGTGLHSVVLARLGVEVTAVDLSAPMLARLEEHASALRLSVRTIRSEFTSLPALLPDRYDGVFCLGNTLPHLLTRDRLLASLAAFRRLLRPSGILLFQTLNYERILRTRERVQSIRDAGDTTFVRFYDFGEETVRFNVLKILRQGGRTSHEMLGVTLRPVLPGEIAALLAEAGFGPVELYGGLGLEEFRPGESADLVGLARVSHAGG